LVCSKVSRFTSSFLCSGNALKPTGQARGVRARRRQAAGQACAGQGGRKRWVSVIPTKPRRKIFCSFGILPPRPPLLGYSRL
jgi:hypothetical protein